MIGIVDLGTNTFNLLIAELTESGLRVVHAEDLGVKLGQGGVEQGAIAADAYERGLKALSQFSEQANAYSVNKFLGLGTSMLRNASNGKQFVREAKERTGIEIQIIKGNEEAAYIVDGVRQAVEFGKKPSLIIDIGGGSVEFIIASKDATLWKQSFEIGTTRLLDRIGMSDPITIAEQLRMNDHLQAQLGLLWIMLEKHRPNMLIGSAGSFDTLAEMILRQEPENASPNDLITCSFTPNAFYKIMDELLVMPRSERLTYPGLPEYRVDTMIAALIIIDVVLQHGISKIHWSKYSMKRRGRLETRPISAFVTHKWKFDVIRCIFVTWQSF